MKHHHSNLNCPLCGGSIGAVPSGEGEIVEMISGLGPRTGRLVAALIERPGTYVPTSTLSMRVWGDDPNGGPISAKVMISQMMRESRNRIPGWRIESKRHCGYRIVKEAHDEQDP